MRYANLYEAKTHLSEFVDIAAAGDEVVIGKNGRPLAKLVPYQPADAIPRTPGAWKGRIVIHADFDVLPEDLEQAFAGTSDD